MAGSWYVETLDSILEENSATNDLVTMLMMVSFIIKKKSLVLSSKNLVNKNWPDLMGFFILFF